MDLTTIDRVKAKKGITGTTLDALLTTLVGGVSTRVASLLDRHVLSTSRTEVHRVQRNANLFWLPGYPVTTLTSVRYASDPTFSGSKLLASSDYYVDTVSGMLDLSFDTSLARGFMQVVYTGGMAADTDAFVTAFPDIADAVDSQVIAELNLAKVPEGEVKISDTGDRGMKGPAMGLLPNTHAIIDQYRRRVW